MVIENDLFRDGSARAESDAVETSIYFETDDERANKSLSDEIREAIENGYDVTIGYTEDIAYENPEMITRIYLNLREKGAIFADFERNTIANSLGAASLEAVGLSEIRKSRRKNENLLEISRAELLFDDTKMPWHMQRGNALALQTIVDAHELITVDGQNAGTGKYETMSGMLPHYDGDYVFGSNDNSLKNLNLRDAIVLSRQRFYETPLDDAILYADAALANLDTFMKAPNTQDFKDIVANCYDSLGIRSRKQEVRAAISNHLDEVLSNNPEKEEMTLLSVGCGTAQAILEVAADIKSRGINPKIILLDQDPIALVAAKQLAKSLDLEDNLELHCERLFDGMKPYEFEKILQGRKVDVAEDTGLREYLPDKLYCNLTAAVWGHLDEKGIMTSGNMNINRPQPEFLGGLMGWRPDVIQRNIEAGFDLHQKSGIEKGNTVARVTRDGVYTLFFSYK